MLTHKRESYWTESITVEKRQFVENTEDKSGFESHGSKVVESNDKFVLEEPYVPYNEHLDTEKGILRLENIY